MFNSLFKAPPLDSFDVALSRERLIQLARILFVDDEEPLLIEELRRTGLSVDHDRVGEDLHNIELQLYDVVILDYFGVGQKLGDMQGLDLLKFIRRVSPRTRVVAYTSRSLTSEEAEFFRLSHTVLSKDTGLGDSLAAVEDQLKKSFEKEHLFEAIVQKLSISDEATKTKAREALSKALKRNDENGFRSFLKKTSAQFSEKAIDAILSRLFGAK